MKVLEFAFDSREDSDYLPHNYHHNCVVYTGTHDNDTLAGWYQAMSRSDREFSVRYMNNARSLPEEIPWDFIRMAHSSVADLAVGTHAGLSGPGYGSPFSMSLLPWEKTGNGGCCRKNAPMNWRKRYGI